MPVPPPSFTVVVRHARGWHANKLLGRLWWCLTNNQPWDEHAAWPRLVTNPEPVAA